ncbi:hypothetical protein H113_00331 [Trichophyton rubrum MR1459]|uniref:Uncharacterized protein n=1 Tax=Trichophyton rubrum (strain ATCC MYA-4607 / CBS 118892) TaxID=559305 RepID=A0A080WJM9_TRIRC|nr:uncharacterized protein TERG_12666 [Trichophyton rubrum CBS 118892]EZG00129.1 hypothetical protein H113_00331 [Trichophyton rubrum MR1459]EZG10958.1 hypothetical protein H106_00218 [Trichophyton rubrum CBS 735.88]KFL62991.1 hypothetical protein TERG_12666 [Trichophyton rubrum CBS 118892]
MLILRMRRKKSRRADICALIRAHGRRGVRVLLVLQRVAVGVADVYVVVVDLSLNRNLNLNFTCAFAFAFALTFANSSLDIAGTSHYNRFADARDTVSPRRQVGRQRTDGRVNGPLSVAFCRLHDRVRLQHCQVPLVDRPAVLWPRNLVWLVQLDLGPGFLYFAFPIRCPWGQRLDDACAE